ncbi:TolC family protein [Rhabdaerophilum sp. SD176]|uniref:TolC family protein n=1 Tax=Rhabdaerophilum sp. SD176 TaxID=2983548 RepID=UPI0024E0069F|nr:TolC family protein [Rhabdaerophilum sp. SD176]
MTLKTLHEFDFRVLRRVSIRASLLGGVAVLLAGCVTVQPENGIALLQASASADLGKEIEKIGSEEIASSAKARVEALLKQPLGADAAVQIALWNNRGLQAAFNELGIADAQRIQASLPPNPRISIARTTASLALEIERQISGSILALATLPARTQIANDRFRSAQLRTLENVLKLAADTRRQYYRAVAANQQVAALVQAKSTAEATAELFKRLGESGGVNKLNQARDFVFYAETGAQLAQARIQQRIEREKLIRLMGLWGQDLVALRLPASLPQMPRLATVREVEAEALKRRVDLQMARADLDALAKSLGLTQATRLIADIDLLGRRTYDREFKDNGAGGLDRESRRTRTLELELEIPIFDFGQSRVAQAEETYMQAANKLAEKAVNIRSEAREAYQVWRGTHDVSRLYQGQVLPLRKIIQEESLLQYNGMLIDVTQLIADARGRMMSQVAAINAKRDFFIADVDFKHALIGGGVSGAAASGGAAPQGGGEPGH